MNVDLSGQLALVTGAGRGIGRACAEGLADAGARVIAVARSEDDLAEVGQHASGRIDTWAADVRDTALIDRIASLEDLSILVNNAGANRPQSFVDVDAETLEFLLDLNVRAAFSVAQAAAKAMIAAGTNGSIIHMSSQMGHVGSPTRTVYCATKHALEGLSRAMAVELAPLGVRVNTVAPTFVATPMALPMLENPEFREFVLGMIPMGKIAEPEDVAAAVVYLASPASAMVTGTSPRVDGGWTAA